MSKFVIICTKGTIPEVHKKKIALIEKLILPNNLSPNPSQHIGDHSLSISIINPNNTLKVNDKAVCLGQMIKPKHDWQKPLGDIPTDGNFTILRFDKDLLEIVGDRVGYRTIWYYCNDNIFIASSSQRAIIAYLEKFTPNDQVYKWMLSSGTIGPDLSWDKNITKCKPDSTITLDRKKWKISIHTQPFNITPSTFNIESAQQKFYNILSNIFQNIQLNNNSWSLPLSGGYDSRALLYFLKKESDSSINTITWGTKDSINNLKSDAYIAKQVAKHFHAKNQFLEINTEAEYTHSVLQRFLVASEGRIDKISGYVDGMNLWNKLFQSGVNGIIRGDQALGCHTVKSKNEVYHDAGLTTFEKFANTRKIDNLLGDYQQIVPNYLEQQSTESLQSWCERLYQTYRIPTVISALNEIKLNFVEVISPYFSKSILDFIRQLPDEHRSNKKLFISIINQLNIDIPLASENSHLNKKVWLRKPKVLNEITEYLFYSHSANHIFPKEYLNYVVENIEEKQPSTFQKSMRKIKNEMLKTGKPIDINNILFRSYIIAKMNDLIKEDLKQMKNLSIKSEFSKTL
ncbi:asparagine synthase-related protein [Chondrinema litorale]|uniref:asparagine synthase-related protein n=1 Tax=Chondrinema litorale TaxID=2994555 RepID=UPI0025433270|nr:asparagine synthase-related protein [Chondrinema litorale]UZS00175.1 asparagine synthase-related protein [Chondrinema litorale]